MQVTPAGVLVAEGIPGSDGAPGQDAVLEMGADYVIFRGSGTQKAMVCWGEVTSSATDFVTVTFPRPFKAPSPEVTLTENTKTSFAALTAFVWMLGGPPTTTTMLVQCMQVPGGTAENSPAGGRKASWVAVGLAA